jgi:hypothetical protein
MPVLFVVYNFLQISLRQYWTMNKEFSQFRNFSAGIKVDTIFENNFTQTNASAKY